VYPDGASPYSCNWDPETEWDVQPWQDIGVGYFTPDRHWVANAFRDELWAAAFTYDPANWTEVEHSYYFEYAYSLPEPGGGGTSFPFSFTVSNDALQHDGYILLQGSALRARVGEECLPIDPLIHPNQNARFLFGWVTDFSMTYEEALAHFDSMIVNVISDNGEPVELMRQEIIPYNPDDWPQYACSFTQ
jgi:hypothetical protein